MKNKTKRLLSLLLCGAVLLGILPTAAFAREVEIVKEVHLVFDMDHLSCFDDGARAAAVASELELQLVDGENWSVGRGRSYLIEKASGKSFDDMKACYGDTVISRKKEYYLAIDLFGFGLRTQSQTNYRVDGLSLAGVRTGNTGWMRLYLYLGKPYASLGDRYTFLYWNGSKPYMVRTYQKNEMIELPVLPSVGADFIGWRSDGGEKTAYRAGEKALVDSHKTLTAIWKPKECTEVSVAALNYDPSKIYEYHVGLDYKELVSQFTEAIQVADGSHMAIWDIRVGYYTEDGEYQRENRPLREEQYYAEVYMTSARGYYNVGVPEWITCTVNGEEPICTVENYGVYVYIPVGRPAPTTPTPRYRITTVSAAADAETAPAGKTVVVTCNEPEAG